MTGQVSFNPSPCDFACTLARQAGQIMRDTLAIGVPVTLKADSSPVTLADTQINQLVIEAVAATYPDHTVNGEEASRPGKDPRFVWSCDPIDGTIPYAMGIPTNVFSLALVDDGRPVLGVVYDPYLDRLYVAEAGGTATLNGEPIHVDTQMKEMQNAWIGTSSPYAGALARVTLEAGLQRAGTRSLSFASCVYESMLVACGQFAGVIFGGVTAHDIAAVKVIVEAAGGRVTDLAGREQRYDQPIRGAIVSNGLIHDELMHQVIEAHI